MANAWNVTALLPLPDRRSVLPPMLLDDPDRSDFDWRWRPDKRLLDFERRKDRDGSLTKWETSGGSETGAAPEEDGGMADGRA